MKTRFSLSTLPWKWLRLALVVGVLLIGAATWSRWWPALSNWVDQSLARNRGTTNPEHEEPEHAEHADHAEHAGHDAENSLELSVQARGNLGLTEEFLKPIELAPYQRTISVPAVIAVRPGRTHIVVSAPLTGVITHVHAVTSESVTPKTLLFEIRLTHEDLVQAQTEFLSTLGELEVENREIERLTPGVESGAVAGRTLLDRQYAKEQLEARLQAQREALRLHGLSQHHVESIEENRRLMRDLQIVAPDIDTHDHDEELQLSSGDMQPVSFDEETDETSERWLMVEDLDVQKGQSVMAGETLCHLADYSRLYIEGQAFERDLNAINNAFAENWPVTAIIDDEAGEVVIENLTLSHLAAEVDLEKRTQSFFVDLPNEVLRNVVNAEEQRFVAWKYRPGQRLEVLVTVEVLEDQFVLPADAIAQEGADSFVFQQNGSHFDRRPVRILHRDQRSVVIANDGSLFPGDVIALRSAHQMQMALKNRSGGGVDPHAGHSH